jgi:hypothetical protein
MPHAFARRARQGRPALVAQGIVALVLDGF